ncbi:MAG: hypothetical protein M3O70_04425 [Actinomycetota bacterium]|nr:hypothetical protein [Actinomycetota bacterium]
MVVEVESIRYVHPDVAIVHNTGSVLTPWRSKLPKEAAVAPDDRGAAD